MSNIFSHNLGFISVIPPIIAIVIALASKEVVFSLLLGILSGALILSNGDLVQMMIIAFKAMSDKIGDNANILIFLGLVGILVTLVTRAGGSIAYGNWASKKITTKRGVLTATSVLGCMMFIDDYFNCLTVGNVMRPVTDKHKISRVKLAYILDSVAAPVCILAPISSWGASVSTYLQDANSGNGMSTFIQLIPYNLYAILTIVMVMCVCIFDIKFGPMAKFEDDAAKNGVMSQVLEENRYNESTTDEKVKGKVCDLIVPIITMIVGTLTMMVYTGGGFSKEVSFLSSFGNSDSSLSLVIGSFMAIISALVMYIPRKIISFKDFTNSVTEGVKSMVSAFIILILAWTISEICSESYLNTGGFLANTVKNSGFSVAILPIIVFVAAGFLGFATGTSWGTMAILIPVCVSICKTGPAAPLLYPILGAVLAGSVLGDHVSPISDTTILSSTGAQCNHLDHVSTQLAYASVVAICCCFGYLLMGFFKTFEIPLIFSLTSLFAALFFINKKNKQKLKTKKL